VNCEINFLSGVSPDILNPEIEILNPKQIPACLPGRLTKSEEPEQMILFY
jgi:hypothetical protein